MWNKQRANQYITEYLSERLQCSKEAFLQEGVVYIENSCQNFPFLEIMTMGRSVVVSASPSILAKVKADTEGKSRDEIFEYPYVYGQSIYYIPDFSVVEGAEFRHEHLEGAEFRYEHLEGNEILNLVGITGFENSLAFDEHGRTPTGIVVCAYKETEIAGIAGASVESSTMWEMGVDVKPEYRGNGLATALVKMLTTQILNKDILPFYCASVTNIGSQKVAARCGLLPCWVSKYGNLLDGSSCYAQIVQGLPKL